MRTTEKACLLSGALAVGLFACSTGHQVEPVSFSGEPLGVELAHLDRLVGDARIVLLGENGHGVREFTEAKVKIVQWLHRDHGFDLVVFESGLYECDSAWRRLGELNAQAALKACLRYPFEHAEVLPLFEYMKATRSSAAPVEFSGMDFQAQGFDTEARAAATFARLEVLDSSLARRLSRADTALYLLPQHGGMGDAVYQYAYRNADSLKAEYRRGAELTSGSSRLIFRLAEGWIDRLATRGRAELEGAESLPGRYYELRDEWMARAVSALADSGGTQRKVVVWLHNDHARYGRFPSASDSIRSTGGYLREWYGDDVISVGFFLGRGTIADNARRPRGVLPIPDEGVESFLARGSATYVVLRGNSDPAVTEWASSERPYLRSGLDTLTLTPMREFDALIYVDSVSVPNYQIRPYLPN
jgi:erythromycin esterase